MTAFAEDQPLARRASLARLPFALRIAVRDLRGGIRGFGIFLACIALGVAAIVGVGSVSRGLSDGLAREGRRILGGDLAFSQMHRPLDANQRVWLAERGTISTIAGLRAMARRPDGNASALIEIKAVGADWPTLGEAVLDPPQSMAVALAPHDGVYGLVADQALAVRLDVKPGDKVAIGDATFEWRGTLVSEPDKLAAGIGFGPRVIFSRAALEATGLVQPGSLVRFTDRLVLRPGSTTDAPALASVVDAAKRAFPEAGWEIRTRDNVSPQFSKNLGHFTEFLTLVGLTALIVGGVGVANAVAAFVDRKRADLATLKSLGATGGEVFVSALTQVMVLGLVGVAIGLLAGAALPFGFVAAFGSLLPFPLVPEIYPGALASGALYGLLTALAFSMAPLGRVHDVPVSALFRDHLDGARRWPRRRYVVLTGLAALALAAAVVGLAYDRKIAAIYLGATLVGFVLLRIMAIGIMALARRLPRPRGMAMRLAISNIHRPGALTPSVVLSLGLGLALLVALTLIDGNIRNELAKTQPGKTPSFFFLDVQSGQVPAFDAFLADKAPDAKIERVPMMRGRVLKLNDTPVDQVKAKEDVAWVLEGDRGITYAQNPPDGSSLKEGAWWPADYKGPPLVSVEAGAAEGLGLKVGDTITVNVLGRALTAKIANLRTVNWRTLGINFVFVFSPNTFAGAPHTLLATATFPDGSAPQRELSLLKEVATAFPTVTSVRVKDALDALNDIVGQLALAIRGAASVALVASVLVLAGALAAGQRARIYDAVILKTLGATRMRLLGALVLEYGLLGLATAFFGILAGSLAAWGIVSKVMKLDGFVWLWGSASGAAAVALVVTVLLGLLGTWRVLGQKPASWLRDL